MPSPRTTLDNHVSVVPHPYAGDMIPVGSRAQSPASDRVRRMFVNPAADGKIICGLRGVTLHISTPDSRVTLSTWTADGAKQRAAAQDQVDAADVLAGGGAYALSYDRVFTGTAGGPILADTVMGGLTAGSRGGGTRFDTLFCSRNDSESFNSRFKRSLPRFGRV